MAQNFGPGIQGGVVLIDPTTGEPYRASGGGVQGPTGATGSYTGPTAPAVDTGESVLWIKTIDGVPADLILVTGD